MAGHSSRGGSQADRFTTCPASYWLQGGVEDTSDSAAEGTAAHLVREWCLNNGTNVSDYIGEEIEVEGNVYTVDYSWAKYIQPGIDRLRQIARKNSTKIYVEEKIDISPWTGFMQKSTLDSCIVLKNGIYLSDFKFGIGIPVNPDGNKQLILYALGFLNKMNLLEDDNITEIFLEIDQPRNYVGGGVWQCSKSDLIEAGEDIRIASALSETRPDLYKPSLKACRFCDASKVNGRCPAYENLHLETLNITAEELDELYSYNGEGHQVIPLDSPRTIDQYRRAVILQNADLIRGWLRNLEYQAKMELLAGKKVLGVKLVKGKPTDRTWSLSEAMMIRKIKKETKLNPYEEVFMSPAKLEKKLPLETFKKLSKYIKVSDGNPQMVRSDDPRPEYRPSKELFNERKEGFKL